MLVGFGAVQLLVLDRLASFKDVHGGESIIQIALTPQRVKRHSFMPWWKSVHEMESSLHRPLT